MTDEMIKTTIEEKLKEVEKQENVRIIAAVESGSRSWGFASPDSDYDVRFLYVRDKQSYLRLDKIRDVIEWQLDEVLDINGWDIKKALQLLYKSNPTVFEWCASPVVYRTSPEFEELKKLLPLYFSLLAYGGIKLPYLSAHRSSQSKEILLGTAAVIGGKMDFRQRMPAANAFFRASRSRIRRLFETRIRAAA